jgi:hypothetical protein
MPREKLKQFGSHTVFGRAAQPAELAPSSSSWQAIKQATVTGEIYGATGGQMLM